MVYGEIKKETPISQISYVMRTGVFETNANSEGLDQSAYQHILIRACKQCLSMFPAVSN